MPVIVGGVEASLRRLAHYDYWSDSLRRSLLLDAKADILIYGMAELTIVELARRMDAGDDLKTITDLPGSVVKAGPDSLPVVDDCAAESRYFESGSPRLCREFPDSDGERRCRFRASPV